jgi:alpha-tubulin suppressor-like RCC1 family protein
MPGFTLGTVASSHNVNGLFTWGFGTLFRLGNNATANVLSPQNQTAFTDWEVVCAGLQRGWAIRKGLLYSWGSNSATGALGNGVTTGTRNTPTQVGTDSGWTSISGISTPAAIRDGKLYTWGLATNGLLGNGTTTPNVTVPTQIGSDTDWEMVSSANTHAAAIKGGKLYSWGSNANYRTGQGTTSGSTNTPTQIGAATNWTIVATTGEATVAINADGEAWSVGSNANGQTGQGTTSGDTTTLTQIGSGSDWEDANGTTCVHALRAGTLWAFGRNLQGQIGDGTTTTRSSPVQIDSNTGWILPRNGGNNNANGVEQAIRDGKLFTWGWASQGALGNGTTTPDVYTPTQIGTDTNWKAVSGNVHVQAIKG